MKRIIDILAIWTTLLFVSINAVAQELPIDQQALDSVGGRRALVGPNCLINQISTSANVATNYSYLNAVTDEDLNNFATITGVQVGLGANPIFSVKDTKHTYKGGTKAGFRILSSEGGGLLSLDLVKMFSIKVFNNGEEKGTYTVENNGNGLNLSLIKIPNSDHISIDLEVTPEEEFDELYLMVNGVKVSAIQELSIKYAFVGEAKEYPLTYNGVKDFANGFEIDDNKCHSMPWLNWKKVQEHILDDDLTNKLSTGGVAIGEWAHMQIGVNNTFPKGTEVGFKYSNAGLLNLSLGGFTTITLYKNGKKVQTETLKAEVLNLGVASSGETKTSVIAQADFDAARLTIGAGVLGVDLGEAAGIYYGYVKKQPDVEHHCPINASVNSTLCENVRTYELKSNPDIDVTWSISSKPQGSSVSLTGNKVSNLTPGTYTFTATAGSKCPYDDSHKCQETVSLTVGRADVIDNTCALPLTNTPGKALYEISNKLHDTSGSLLSISNLKNGQNVLDENENNYATYVGGLSVANDLGIIGLKTKDGSPFGQDINAESDKRIGFIVENASTFLNADVLEFFQIRLYRNGVRLKSNGIPEVIDESNTVDVGLIGTEKSQKVRFSIRVPKEIEFDEFQLWKSGVLDLGLGTLRIYYGFIEDANSNCSDPVANNCGVVLSSTTTHARFAPVIPFQTASVAMVLSHAEYLIDDDLTTAMNYNPTVSVGGGITFSIKLGKTLDNKQQLGVVIDNKTYLAGIKVGAWMTLETYLNGKKTGEKFDNWGTVGLDVIGYGDKKFLLQTPQLPYDEVCITFAGIAELLNGYQIYGLFFRGDQDGDGLPDCSDPDLCNNNLSNLAVTQDICLGDVIKIGGVANFDCPENSIRTLKYQATYREAKQTGSTEQPLGVIEISKNSSLPTIFEKEFTPTQSGQFVLSLSLIKENGEEDDIYDGASQNLFFNVHPKRTTWKSSPNLAYNWNEWDNWDNGAPWNCTDVIISNTAEGTYPILNQGEYNACHYLHFKPGTEVVNTHLLDYEKAWIDAQLSPNRYYMMAIPLKEVRSGDWFIAKNQPAYNDYFQILDNHSYPENRVTPTIYQRLWESKAYHRTINGGMEIVYPAESHWTKPTNMLSEYYDTDNGFAMSVWVHPLTPEDQGEGDANMTYLFRFPKEHEKYFYYNAQGNILEHSEQTHRRTSNIGRFIYEDQQRKVKFPYLEKVKTLNYQNTTYLVANPFMSHIDVKTFLDNNPEITTVKVYRGNANNSLIQADGQLITSIAGGEHSCTKIAPLESFFVTFKDSKDELNERYITFTEQMLCLGKEINQVKMRKRQPEGTIRLSLTSDKEAVGAVILLSDTKDDAFREEEDSEILVDPKNSNEFSVFSIADNRALDIQQRKSAEIIPLGFYCPKEMALVEMNIEMPEDFEGWTLKDQRTGNEYGLRPGKKNTILLNQLSTNVGRFYLANESSDHLAFGEEAHPYVFQQESSITVRCEEMEITSCQLFTLEGKKVQHLKIHSRECRLHSNKGVYLIKVTLTDGSSHTLKFNCR